MQEGLGGWASTPEEMRNSMCTSHRLTTSTRILTGYISSSEKHIFRKEKFLTKMNVCAQYVAGVCRALDSMYPLSQFAIEKSAFRVAGGAREAIPFFAFKNLLTLLRKNRRTSCMQKQSTQ